MAKRPNHEALTPNPALKAFGVPIGEWSTVGTHPLVPGTTFHGHTSFEWLEGGAFLIMHSEIQEPDIPNGVAIFGSDDSAGECFMLYAVDSPKLMTGFVLCASVAVPHERRNRSWTSTC